MADLAVVIVTWNGWELTRRALASLFADAAAAGATLEVIVVDNGSTDGTVERLRDEFPAVACLPLGENLGFAAANNRALAHVTAPLVFLLNNDTVVEPGTVAALLAAARGAPGYAIFATQMVQLHAPDRVDNRGIYLDATAHCRQLDTGAPVEPGPDASEIFGASGGACVVRTEVLRRIGLFDESLGSYWEDGDFACRARASGYRCLYVPGARILHEGSATGNRLPDRKLYLIQRNMAIVCQRWLPFRPLRGWAWLSLAREAYYVLQAVVNRQAMLVLAAKREGFRRARAEAVSFPDGQRDAARRRLEEWIGVRMRATDAAPPPVETRR